MNTLHKILLGVFGGGGFTATTSWFIYDNLINPTLAKSFGSKWNPIKLTINTPPKPPSAEDTSSPSYSGSSCFQKFFGGLEIQKFSALSTSSNSLSSSKFDTLFKDSKSDIYGCAVGEKDNFYELVLKNEEVGFTTWFDNSDQNNSYKQRTFVLKKEKDSWKIELGIWTTKQKDVDQIKSKTSKENWSWLFYMPKAQVSNNMQKWSDVFKGKNRNAFYDTKENIWNVSALLGKHTEGQIPKFDKVETLDDFCETQGAIRGKKINNNNDEAKKLEVFCLSSK